MRLCRFLRKFNTVPKALPQRGRHPLLALALLGALVSPALAQAPQDLAELQAQVTDYLQQYYQTSEIERAKVTVGRLDPRLRLAACPSALELSHQDAERRGGNLTVHTRCPGPTPWALYVPAEVAVYRQIAVASRSLGRGHRLSAGDITLAVRDTGQLRQGFVTQAETAVGMALRRPLQAGDPVRLSQLEAPTVVRRGDQVRLKAKTGTITVDTKGTALSDGRVGDQVRVRNDRSERVVRGRVIGPGTVEVVL
ncbi:flagellar basal body P-ring formation chaperone FlgA [Marinimicrobium agarilyticum]|uniref:flagellar basal body P-ring formation chaperone FlgA n=1 Tax=Marinimicrobium agarilyticum TaxID=306546 RepID=UPI0006841833|nr:flagellar basal body P-ring formation chaperone FlgA [Marinimicrobium agarilyticum]